MARLEKLRSQRWLDRNDFRSFNHRSRVMQMGDQITVTDKTVAGNLEGADCFNDDVIRPWAKPVYAEGALAVLRGNLAPNGCVIKPSGARIIRTCASVPTPPAVCTVSCFTVPSTDAVKVVSFSRCMALCFCAGRMSPCMKLESDRN